MKLNYETCLVGKKVILVPYRPEHVPKYHEWMKDPALLEATGSEPLSLEEELEMQQSWRDDPKKCTFIVHSNLNSGFGMEESSSSSFIVGDHLDTMIGDVNLFLSECELETDDDENEDQTNGYTNSNNNAKENDDDSTVPVRLQAEIDIMIAERAFQKQGLGKAATCSMLLYGMNTLGIHRFFCKINQDNVASIQLFTSLGFVQCGYAECFRQIEMELVVKQQSLPLEEELKSTLQALGGYTTVPCPISTSDE